MRAARLGSCRKVFRYSVVRHASRRAGAAEHKGAAYSSVVVTKHNFKSLLGSILQHIQDADFLAIDTVLTGMRSAPWRAIHALDTPETTYHKLKDSSENFSVLEFGLCTFAWHELDQKFVARPYNFYLFPHDNLKVEFDSKSFLCEIATLECLAKRGFDFNTCIQHGISYLSIDQESMARVKLGFKGEGKHKLGRFSNLHQNNLEMNSVDKMFSCHIRAKLRQWRAAVKVKNSGFHHYQTNDKSGVAKMDGCSERKSVQCEFSVFGHKDQKFTRLVDSYVIWYNSCEPPGLVRASMKLDSLGHRELSVLLEVVRVDFDDLVAVVQPESLFSRSRNAHVFLAASHKEKLDLLEELEQCESKEKEMQLAGSIGFRQIVDAMVKSKKPIIGHECFLDFAHIFKSFFKPLPMTTAKFAAGLLEKFPCVVDTKYVLQNIPQLENDKNTPIPALFLKLCGSQADENGGVIPKISNQEKTKTDPALNERVRPKPVEELGNDSGINAYFAGCVFALMCNLTNTDPCELKKLTITEGKSDLQRHVNLLCMSDSPSILDLSMGCVTPKSSGSQKQLDGVNALLIWGYLRGTSPLSIKTAVGKALGSHHPVDVFLLDDSCALLQFNCPEAVEQFHLVLQRLTKCEDPDILPLSGMGVRAARFAAYEYLCKYSPSMHKLADCAMHLQVGLSGL